MGTPSKFKFRRHDTIGAADAEDDKAFLATCFIDKGDLDILRDRDDPRAIVVGRTGTGKTALLLKLAALEPRSICVKPESLALSYISNSTVLSFLFNLGLNLDIFYKLLWRHVFAVEIMKHHFQLNTAKSLNPFRQTIRALLRKKSERNALKYLEKWGETFWEETEYRIKEVVKEFENQVKSNVCAGIPKFSFSGAAAAKLNKEERTEVVQRAQYVLNNVQVRHLSEIVELIDAILTDRQKRYFITIDRLDEEWIEDRLRYKLIRALVETAREFGKVENAKIVVAIRQDVLDRVFRVVRDAGYQEEKYKSLYLNVEWTRKQLTDLLDARVDHLIKQRYTKQEVTHSDVFPKTVDNRDTMEFIVARTMMQPRDMIHFLNKCIQAAQGLPQISARMVKQAEGEYSRDRLRYLADEWYADYPSFIQFAMILKKKPSHFAIEDLTSGECEEFCLEFVASHEMRSDYLGNLANHVVNAQLAPDDFWRSLFPVFYKVGFVGLKIETYQKYVWTFSDRRNVSSAEISGKTRVAIHPAFWRVLGTRKT